MIERTWTKVGPYTFAANGSDQGKVTLATTLGLRTKMAVTINHPTLPPLNLEVKRVTKTAVWLGEPGNIKARAKLAAYDNLSTITAEEQPRPQIPTTEHERATYEEEPIVAKRVIQVDPLGEYYTTDNPLPVQLTDGNINIDTLNANLQVQLSANDNDPNPGDVHDSVRIGSPSGNEMDVNPDGSINVNVIQSPSVSIAGLSVYYNEALSVPSASETTVLTVTATAPAGLRFTKVEVSGENVAIFKVKVDGVVMAQKRIWWNAWNETFDFESFVNGLLLAQGQVLTVTVFHSRPELGNFNASAYAE